MLKRILFLLLFLPIALAAHSPTGGFDEAAPVRVELVSEQEAVKAGEPFWVGIRMNMEKGWHTYWKNPGDSGFPTSVEWNLPEGFEVGDLQWPSPQRFEERSIVSYGYEEEVLLLALIKPPKILPPGESVDIGAEVSWLACHDSCLPGFANVSHSLPVVRSAAQVGSAWGDLFSKWRSRLPQELLRTRVSVDGEALLLDLPEVVSKSSRLSFFPDEGTSLDHAVPIEIVDRAEGKALRFACRRDVDRGNAPVKGVVVDEERQLAYSLEADLAASGRVAWGQEVGGVTVARDAFQVDTKITTFGLALLFAFLGGVILNLMPCVLPVISLKVMSFVQLKEKGRAEGVRHGMAFTLGVLLSFWVLAGALLMLRAYGEGVGWGFQLQNPVFVAILAGIIFLMGLSLFGLFEVGASMVQLGSVSSKTKGLVSSFLTGVLATAVATPCTGPMLGPALGYAVTLPALMSLTVFSAIALGLSAPYLLLAIMPEWLRFLPKPGAWMITFKQIMGFFMMATLIWLMWVFAAEVGSALYVIGLVGSFFVLSLGGWIFGKWGTPQRKKRLRYAMRAVALVAIAMGFFGAVKVAKWGEYTSSSSVAVERETGFWSAWDPDKVADLRAMGTPVFVDFTAKWCLTCQANKAALRSDEVREAFEAAGVVAMEADWTRRDPRITEHLGELGRNGVPVYVFYSSDPSEPPKILPQILSSGKVVSAIQGQ